MTLIDCTCSVNNMLQSNLENFLYEQSMIYENLSDKGGFNKKNIKIFNNKPETILREMRENNFFIKSN